MRRADKEIVNTMEMEDILRSGRVCQLGLNDNGLTYVIPVSYGYEDGYLYVHSAREGRKIDILRRNNIVSFAIYIDDCPVPSDVACNWGMKYRCVMGTGTADMVEEEKEKEKALRIIVKHYAGPVSAIEAAGVSSVLIIRVLISSLTGKKSG